MPRFTDEPATPTTVAAPVTGVSRFVVAGMTCEHCTRAVSSELSGIPGVVSVQVTLATGDVTLTHDRPLDPGLVAAAVAEAGYRLTT